MNLTTPRGFDCTPSARQVGGCALRLIHTSLVGLVAYVCVLVVATTVDAWLHRGPDPRLLRAACASKTSGDLGRRMLSMVSIPRGAAIVREIQASTEAELAAWADVDARCEP